MDSKLTDQWQKHPLLCQAKVHADTLAWSGAEGQPGHSPILICFAAFQEAVRVILFRILPDARVVMQFIDIEGNFGTFGYNDSVKLFIFGSISSYDSSCWRIDSKGLFTCYEFPVSTNLTLYKTSVYDLTSLMTQLMYFKDFTCSSVGNMSWGSSPKTAIASCLAFSWISW